MGAKTTEKNQRRSLPVRLLRRVGWTNRHRTAASSPHGERALGLLLFLAACTTLGPMPATTGISAVPAARPGMEAQAGFVPAYFLSTSVQDEAQGTVTSQLSALVEQG